MKDDDFLEEIVYLNITINKYLMKVSAQYSEVYFLLYWHARELVFEALTTCWLLSSL